MSRAGLALVLLLSGAFLLPASAQSRKTARPVAAKAVQPVTEPAVFRCPSALGQGGTSGQEYCDVVTGRDQAEGILLELPPHVGDLTLTFSLHNRHTYSEELVRSGKGYRKYTATIGVLTADNTLLSRAVVQNEFRTQTDLVERITGGAGPGGLKAVAPSGVEPVSVVVPEEETRVSILGEKLLVIRADGTDNFTTPGRPIALVSHVLLTYRPKPVKAQAKPVSKPAAKPARPAQRPKR